MTLDDLERRNCPNRRVILLNSIAFRADYIKVLEDTPIYFPQRKCRSENLVFNDISFTAIVAGDHPQRER